MSDAVYSHEMPGWERGVREGRAGDVVRCNDRNGGTGGMGGEAVQGASARSAVIQKLGIAMGTGMWCLVYA